MTKITLGLPNNPSMRNKLFVGCVLVVLMFIYSQRTLASQPSFNCNKAASASEIDICKSDKLAQLDVELSALYRAFLKKQNPQNALIARHLQSLWIKGRDVRCGGKVYAVVNTDNGHIPGELDVNPPKSLDACLAEYYQGGIQAFRKGVLLSYVFLEKERTHYSVGLKGMDQLLVTPPNKPVKDCDDRSYKPGQLNIVNGESHIAIGVMDVANCGSYDYNRSFVSELRFYLTESGTMFYAEKNVDDSAGGECGYGEQTYLKFFKFDKDGKAFAWIGALHEDDRGGFALRDEMQTCGGTDNHVTSWNAAPASLTYRFIVNNSWYYWDVFPDVYSITVDNGDAGYTKVVPSSYDAQVLEKPEFSNVLGKLYYDDTVAPYYDSMNAGACAPVLKGINDYVKLKEYAITQGVTLPHALFLAAKEVGKFNYSRLQGITHATAQAFLKYLDEARKQKGWEQDLPKFAGGYADINHHYFHMDNPEVQKMLKDKGYYTDPGCFSKVEISGAKNLEDWIYMFWGRRESDGTLKQSELFFNEILRASSK